MAERRFRRDLLTATAPPCGSLRCEGEFSVEWARLFGMLFKQFTDALNAVKLVGRNGPY
jgi:hypothetical protein